MRSREEKQLAKQLYQSFLEGNVQRYGYKEISVVIDQQTIRVDISGGQLLFPACVMIYKSSRFKKFGLWQRRKFLKLYHSSEKRTQTRESLSSAQEIADVFGTPDKVLRDAAKEVKTWVE